MASPIFLRVFTLVPTISSCSSCCAMIICGQHRGTLSYCVLQHKPFVRTAPSVSGKCSLILGAEGVSPDTNPVSKVMSVGATREVFVG